MNWKNRATLTILVFAGPALLVGCSQRKAEPATTTYVTREGIIDESPKLSQSERAEHYRQSFAHGMTLVEKKQYGLALASFEEAARMDPRSEEAAFNLGACYEQVGDPLRAIQIYRRLLQANPGDWQCYCNLGTSYIKMFVMERSPVWRRLAIEAWKQSLALNPDQPGVRRYLVQAESSD